MPAPRSAFWQKSVAILAMIVMLTISSAAALPGHWHNNPQGGRCDICRSGHLATPQPLDRVEIQAPAKIEWRQAPVELRRESEPVLAYSSPRAPPV
jgi:hypothetical protein